MSYVNSEVQYMGPEGGVHSDLEATDRALLHSALDEWLDNSGGTGFFYVGDIHDLASEFGVSDA